MQQDVNNNMKVFDPSEVLKQNDIGDENKLIKNPSVSDGYKNFMIEKIMTTWQEQQSTDRKLRSKYAKYFICILIVELVVIMCIMVAVGRGGLIYDAVSLDLFLAATITQIFLSMRIAIKYLFSKDSNVGLKDIAKIIGNISRET